MENLFKVDKSMANHKTPMTKQSSAPLVFAIVLNWNGWRDTLACLKSLDRLTYSNLKSIVVDNASHDDSVDILKAERPHLFLIENDNNLGYAGGNNVGIRHALANGAEYVWILNNDTTVKSDSLTYMIKRMQETVDAGMCGSTLVYAHDRRTVQALGGGSYNRWLGTVQHLGAGRLADGSIDQNVVEPRLDYINGASLLVSSELIKEVGPLCEDYFLYFEELDWSMRARGRFHLVYAARSIVYHKEGARVGANNRDLATKSLLADFYALRNRLLFTRRFFPFAHLPVRLGLFVALLNRIRRKQWERIGWIIQLIFTSDPATLTLDGTVVEQ